MFTTFVPHFNEHVQNNKQKPWIANVILNSIKQIFFTRIHKDKKPLLLWEI